MGPGTEERNLFLNLVSKERDRVEEEEDEENEEMEEAEDEARASDAIN